jgi:malonate decarboxylase delta subunit
MEHLSYAFEGGERSGRAAAIVVGVVSSGNLEVMIEPTPADASCVITVDTPARGFDTVWAAVLDDFFERTRLGGVRISINDVGATPAVVSLRLDQAVETFLSSSGNGPR